MSDERLEELGLARRAFLKKAAAAGFVAPLVVTFGLEAVAASPAHAIPNQAGQRECEGISHHFPNQPCQIPPRF